MHFGFQIADFRYKKTKSETLHSKHEAFDP